MIVFSLFNFPLPKTFDKGIKTPKASIKVPIPPNEIGNKNIALA